MQFWEDWSADEVWPGVWIGNKGAALKVVEVIIVIIAIGIIVIIGLPTSGGAQCGRDYHHC